MFSTNIPGMNATRNFVRRRFYNNQSSRAFNDTTSYRGLRDSLSISLTNLIPLHGWSRLRIGCQCGTEPNTSPNATFKIFKTQPGKNVSVADMLCNSFIKTLVTSKSNKTQTTPTTNRLCKKQNITINLVILTNKKEETLNNRKHDYHAIFVDYNANQFQCHQ